MLSVSLFAAISVLFPLPLGHLPTSNVGQTENGNSKTLQKAQFRICAEHYAYTTASASATAAASADASAAWLYSLLLRQFPGTNIHVQNAVLIEAAPLSTATEFA